MSSLDSARTAFVVIDLMPRIVTQPTEPSSGQEVLERCVALADGLRAQGSCVVWVRVERPGVDPQPPGSHLAVTPQQGDLEIVKHTWGAFQGTGLDGVLRQRAVEHVVLGGLVTNFGVESTARAADDHGYRVIVVEDATSGLHALAHDFAANYILPRLGMVTRTDIVLAAL